MPGSSRRAANRPFCARGRPGAVPKGSAGAWTTALSGKRRSVALPIWDLRRKSPVVDMAPCKDALAAGCPPSLLRTAVGHEATPGCPAQRFLPALHEMMRNQAPKKVPCCPQAGPGDVLTDRRELSWALPCCPPWCPVAAAPTGAGSPFWPAPPSAEGLLGGCGLNKSPPVLAPPNVYSPFCACLLHPHGTEQSPATELFSFLFSSTFP